MGRHQLEPAAASRGAPRRSKLPWIIAIVSLVVAGSVTVMLLRGAGSSDDAKEGVTGASTDRASTGVTDTAGTGTSEQHDTPAPPAEIATDIPVDATGQRDDSAQEGHFPTDVPAAVAGSTPCIEVPVLASIENQRLLDALAAAYTSVPRNVDGRCVTVTVGAEQSGPAAEAAAGGFSDRPADERPAIWAPDSTVWLSQAHYAGGAGAEVVPEYGSPFARTAIVVAVPQSVARELDWVANPPSWRRVLSVAASPNVWKDTGLRDWGEFRFGKTSPQLTTSGLMAMVAEYGVAAGAVGEVTEAMIDDETITANVQTYEQAVNQYIASPQNFLWQMRTAADAGQATHFLSAAVIDEASVMMYNSGISSADGVTYTTMAPPSEPLVPIYPSDGVHEAVSVAAPLTGSWLSAAQEDAAIDFVTFLGSDAGQRVVRVNGFRDITGIAGDESVVVGKYSPGILTLPTPDAEVATAAAQSFHIARKNARILFLVDVSGSMDNPVDGDRSRLDAARAAVDSAIDSLPQDDEVGLAAFSNYDQGELVPGMVSPPRPLSSSRAAFDAALAGLKPVSQTPLYLAVKEFGTWMARDADPGKINAIVLLSDGINDTSDNTTLKQALDALTATRTAGTPIMVFTLAYSDAADTAVLQKISQVSGAQYYDATDPTKIGAVLQDLISAL